MLATAAPPAMYLATAGIADSSGSGGSCAAKAEAWRLATSVRREVPEGFRIEGPVPDDGVENRRPCCFEAREAGRRAATLYTEAARRAMAVCGGGSTTGGRMYSFLGK